MTAPLDFTKPIRCRNGRAVKIFMTDAGGTYPILGAVWSDADQMWEQEHWMANGRFGFSDPPHIAALDLVNYEEPGA